MRWLSFVKLDERYRCNLKVHQNLQYIIPTHIIVRIILTSIYVHASSSTFRCLDEVWNVVFSHMETSLPHVLVLYWWDSYMLTSQAKTNLYPPNKNFIINSHNSHQQDGSLRSYKFITTRSPPSNKPLTANQWKLLRNNELDSFINFCHLSAMNVAIPSHPTPCWYIWCQYLGIASKHHLFEVFHKVKSCKSKPLGDPYQ